MPLGEKLRQRTLGFPIMKLAVYKGLVQDKVVGGSQGHSEIVMLR